MSTKAFNPQQDIPDLSGKVIFITGGTAGLGRESVLALAGHNPSHIYFTGRNSTAASDLRSELQTASPFVQVTFLEMDLASLSSVSAAARKFTATSSRLDILMLNAGVMALPTGLTSDGYEIQFGTNCLGHAMLTKLLLPTLLRTAAEPGADVRVITLTSNKFSAHPLGGVVLKNLRTVQESPVAGGWIRYGQSKLANLLYAAELARRYPAITSISVHPGFVETETRKQLSWGNRVVGFLSNMDMKAVQPSEGAWNQLWAATVEKGKIVNGTYYVPVGVPGKLEREASNAKLACELWEWTEKELAKYMA